MLNKRVKDRSQPSKSPGIRDDWTKAPAGQPMRSPHALFPPGDHLQAAPGHATPMTRQGSCDGLLPSAVRQIPRWYCCRTDNVLVDDFVGHHSWCFTRGHGATGAKTRDVAIPFLSFYTWVRICIVMLTNSALCALRHPNAPVVDLSQGFGNITLTGIQRCVNISKIADTLHIPYMTLHYEFPLSYTGDIDCYKNPPSTQPARSCRRRSSRK